MAWDRIINYYLDVDATSGRSLLRLKTPDGLDRADDIVQGDYPTVRLWFRQKSSTTGSQTTAVELGATDEIVLAGKKSDGLSAATLLFSATAFSKVGTEDDIYYEAELNLNTTELDDAFTALTGNILTCTVDVEVQNADNSRRRTLQFEQRVLRQVYDGEADPTPGTPDYPLPSALFIIGNNLSELDDPAEARTNLGLGNVDNTSDADKPVSTAQQAALDLKAGLTHASRHQHGGADEIATATPGAHAIPKADGSGKLASGWLPDSVIGQIEYQGTWDAGTNTPTISAASSGNKGHYYVVSNAGSTDIDGTTDWQPGDWLVSNGSTWDKVDNTEPAASETLAGLIEIADQAEGDAGTDDARAITPAKLANFAGTFAASWQGDGVGYEFPNQAADNGSRAMTRDLTDARHIRRAPVADPDDLTIVETLTGNQTLTAASEPIRYVTPDAGGHTITLPEIAASPAGDQVAPGWRLKIINEGMHSIDIHNDSDVLELRLDPGETAQFLATSTSWIVARAPQNGVFEIRLLAQNLTAAGPVSLYTPQAGLEFLPHHGFVVLRTVDTVSVDAVVKLTDGTDDLTASLTLSTPTVGNAHEFAMSNPRNLATPTGPLTLALPTPATATELVGDIYVYGSLIPAP